MRSTLGVTAKQVHGSDPELRVLGEIVPQPVESLFVHDDTSERQYTILSVLQEDLPESSLRSPGIYARAGPDWRTRPDHWYAARQTTPSSPGRGEGDGRRGLG
jgi:hypothetical protein